MAYVHLSSLFELYSCIHINLEIFKIEIIYILAQA